MRHSDRDGMQAPRSVARILDILAVLTVVGGVVVAVSAVGAAGNDNSGAAVAAIRLNLAVVLGAMLAAILVLCGTAVFMRWLAAMYEAANGEPAVAGRAAPAATPSAGRGGVGGYEGRLSDWEGPSSEATRRHRWPSEP